MKPRLRTLAIALIAIGTIWAASTPNAIGQARTFDKPTAATATGNGTTAGTVTVNGQSGTVTTEALTTAASAQYALTVTNDRISATSVVLATVANGTNTATEPIISRITPAAGSVAITVRNAAVGAFNGTLKITFVVLIP